MDTPTLPVMSLQQLLHIDNDLKKNDFSGQFENQNKEEEEEDEEDILLDLTNLNINDINMELRQLRDDLKFDYQTIMQHLKNNRVILQKKTYTQKLTALNEEIMQMKHLKENWEQDKLQQKKELNDKIKLKDIEMNDLNNATEFLKAEKLSSGLLLELKQWRDTLNKQETEIIEIQKQLVHLDLEIENLKTNDKNLINTSYASLEDRILLDVMNVELNNQQTGYFIGETNFIQVPKISDNSFKFTEDIRENAWKTLKQDYESLDII
ncbi:hypothetical protein QEN19_002823 [Hanseniaspora menglaensis]